MTAMTALQTFEFESRPVRSLLRDEQPWFVGKDVCDALGLSNSRRALSRLDADEKGVTISYPPEHIPNGGGRQEVTIVSEPGVYRLVFTSRTESAERFKRWLAHDVLPVLRRTGAFVMAQPVAAPSDADDLPTARDERLWGQSVAKMNAVARTLAVVERIYGPDAARALWEREKGLPKLARFTVAAQAARPSADPMGCWRHLMRAATSLGLPLGKMLDLALHDKVAAGRLRDYGVAVDPDRAKGHVAVANDNRFLASVFAGTPWADDWRLAFAALPGARPAQTQIAFGAERSKAVLLPRDEVARLRHPTH